MPARKPLNIAPMVIAAFFGLLCVLSPAEGRHMADGKGKPIVLWVREIGGQALYWVNDKPWGRAPLSGLVAAMDSDENVSLTVILDSRVPIQEMADIESLMAKMDIKNVRYYVYVPAYPNIGMSEIVWKAETIPLPKSPPPLGKP
jgi:hypothetical protein